MHVSLLSLRAYEPSITVSARLMDADQTMWKGEINQD